MKSYLSTALLFTLFFTTQSQSLSFEGITEIKPLKRGSTYQVNWSGGSEDDNLIIDIIVNKK